VHRALINYVRQQVAVELPDRRKLARDVRGRGRAALELLAVGLGEYASKD
jgi:hypothetical protein